MCLCEKATCTIALWNVKINEPKYNSINNFLSFSLSLFLFELLSFSNLYSKFAHAYIVVFFHAVGNLRKLGNCFFFFFERWLCKGINNVATNFTAVFVCLFVYQTAN